MQQEIREELAKEFTTEQKDKAWTEAAEAVKTYYDDLLRRWKEELDTLLVYVRHMPHPPMNLHSLPLRLEFRRRS